MWMRYKVRLCATCACALVSNRDHEGCPAGWDDLGSSWSLGIHKREVLAPISAEVDPVSCGDVLAQGFQWVEGQRRQRHT